MPVRKAILIKGPGGTDALETGGEKDVHFMEMFLRSAMGGAWLANEIVTLRNPSWERIQWERDKSSADYSITYFSGHGTASGSESFLKINDFDLISEYSLLDASPRQLIIGDHCRSYLPAGMAGIQEEQEPFAQVEDWQAARLIFDKAILGSPIGKTFVWASAVGQKAFGGSSGSAFTLELLELCHRWIGPKALSPIYVEEIIPKVGTVLDKGSCSQSPEFCSFEGRLRVPLALTTAVPIWFPAAGRNEGKAIRPVKLFPGYTGNLSNSTKETPNSIPWLIAFGALALVSLCANKD